MPRNQKHALSSEPWISDCVWLWTHFQRKSKRYEPHSMLYNKLPKIRVKNTLQAEQDYKYRCCVLKERVSPSEERVLPSFCTRAQA